MKLEDLKQSELQEFINSIKRRDPSVKIEPYKDGVRVIDPDPDPHDGSIVLKNAVFKRR